VTLPRWFPPRPYEGTGLSLELPASIIAGTGLNMAAGLSEHQGRSTGHTVPDWLATRQAVLVLDNCEHLLGGVAALLERLLPGGPEIPVLVSVSFGGGWPGTGRA
jgi:hypothetical protein